MKRLLTTTLFTLLFVSLAFATEECSFAPTAKITNITNGENIRTETTIQLSGATSTPNNCSGYITEYRWRLLPSGGSWSTLYTGGTSTYNHTFTLPANVHELSYTLELRVKNNINLYNTKTITVTVKRPQRIYHLTDHIGNVRTSVDVDGNVVGYDDYYPFGKVMPGRSDNTSNPNDDYKFTGHERDDEAGLTIDFMNARTYDPITGRFNQIDPLSDQFAGWTPYHYVHNNPLNLTDPTGMAACPPACGAFNSTINTVENMRAIAGDETAQKAVKFRVGVQVGFISLFVPGPEDVALAVVAATKAVQVAGRSAGRIGMAMKKLIKGTEEVAPVTKKIYKRPNNATTAAQRESVQGKPCVTCGAKGQKNVADHKNPLVKEHYETGGIDKTKMKSLDAVQPQCVSCSAKQGAEMSKYSKAMKKIIEKQGGE